MKVNDLQKLLCLMLGLVFLFFGAVDPVGAGTIDPTLEHALQLLDSQDELPVIIKAVGKAQLDLVQDKDKGVRRSKINKALRSKADLPHRDIKAFSQIKSVRNLRSLWIINSTALSASADVIRELATLPQVESITLDAVLHAPVTNAGTQAMPEWNISAIHAPELWTLGHTGTGIVVASMDSGVDADHPDLQNKWRGGTNSWFDPNGQHASPADVLGHGTQTMGIMVGGDAGGSSIGVAPGAQWIAVKIFNDAGAASYSAIHQGFQWLLDPDNNPDTDDAPDAVNNSWGLTDPNHGCITEFQQDVQALKAAGIAVIFSAGNDGPGSATGLSPANYAESFSVGAVDNTNTIIGLSSRGPSACSGDIFPYVVAPGADILTTDLYFDIPGAYTTVSGSSFSAAHLTGTMALLLNAFPEATVPELEAALKASATDLGLAGTDNDYGYGLINAVGAYNVLFELYPQYDTVPPTGSVTINGGAVSTNNRNVTLTLSAIDLDNAVTNMQLSWDNATWLGWEAYAATRNISMPSGSYGTNTVYVQFRDAAGNISATYSDSIIYAAMPNTPTSTAAAINVSPLRITLTWIDASNDETGFAVWRSDNGGAFTQLGMVSRSASQSAATGDSVTFNNTTALVLGTTYRYYVTAVNANGSSADSNTAVVNFTTPTSPGGLTGAAVRIAGNNSSDRVTLNWTDYSNNESGFNVQRATIGGSKTTCPAAGSGKWKNQGSAGTNVTMYNQNVSRSKNFCYRVQATNGVGNSAWSPGVLVTTP